MSIYDSSTPSRSDSFETKQAKRRIISVMEEQLNAKGFKTFIYTEVPATFTNPLMCYHLDIGVLFRDKKEFDFYHFFAVEVDDSTHRTVTHEEKDDIRDDAFLINKGIVTCRIPLEKITGPSKLVNDNDLFKTYIFTDILHAYLIMPAESVKQQMWSEINRKFSIQLKENAFTACRNCKHKSFQHDLCGCQFRFTNKAKLLCDCKEPFLRSDEI